MLEQIRGPADLQHLSQSQLTRTGQEIRDFLVAKVAVTGGHLGPNLGVVELTLALHRVFDSPHDPIIFDTGHQAYVHKILTGRKARFDRLRNRAGCRAIRRAPRASTTGSSPPTPRRRCPTPTGWPRRSRSPGTDRHVVAVVGDGALTGGMCWEALNNIAAGATARWSWWSTTTAAPTRRPSAAWPTGSMLRMQPAYERVLDTAKAFRGLPVIGELGYQCVHASRRASRTR